MTRLHPSHADRSLPSRVCVQALVMAKSSRNSRVEKRLLTERERGECDVIEARSVGPSDVPGTSSHIS